MKFFYEFFNFCTKTAYYHSSDTKISRNRRRYSSPCASRAILLSLAAIKAAALVVWLMRDYLHLDHNCINVLQWKERALSAEDVDVRQQASEKIFAGIAASMQPSMIVLRQKNNNALWYTDKDFIPHRPGARNAQHSSDIEPKRRKRDANAEDASPNHEESSTGSRRFRIVKIVRRPLNNSREKLFDNSDASHKRHWRGVSINAGDVSTPSTINQQRRFKTVVRIVPLQKLGVEFPSAASTQEDVVRTRTLQKKVLRRVKVVKRRRKPKNQVSIASNSDNESASNEFTLANNAERSRTDKRRLSQDRRDTATQNETVAFVESMTVTQESYINLSNEDAELKSSQKNKEQSQQLNTKSRIANWHKSAFSHFLIQFDIFKRDALCVTRALLDAWCGVQLVALALLVIGVTASICCHNTHVTTAKYLMMPHLILDSLFLLTLIVFALTTAVFGVLLFLLVKEMTLSQFSHWLTFSGIILVVFTLYTITFALTVRSADALLHAFLCAEMAKNHTSNFAATSCSCRNCRITYDADKISQHQLLLDHPMDV